MVIGILLLLIAAGLVWHFTAAGTPKKVENDGGEIVAEDDVIRTPYGDLTYPGVWTDKVSYEIVEDGADFRIVFRSTLEDAEMELFTLCYGTAPDSAYVMGRMSDGTAVSVDMKALGPVENEEVLTLQESINDLLVQIRQHADFTETS